MDIKLLKQQVERVIGTSLSENVRETQAWNHVMSERSGQDAGPYRIDDRWVWFVDREPGGIRVLETELSKVSEAEARLIHLLLSAARESSHPVPNPKRDDETRSIQLGEWLQERIELGELNLPLPEHFPMKPKLKGRMLPFLLNWESSGQGQALSFSKLNKLLKSYFGSEVILVPLKEDWLILLAEELFMSLREESEEAAETELDLLGALCQGLYELVTNEWVGGFHLTVGGTLIGEAELASATLFLRQTLALGRVFNVTDPIHLPWELKLERLIYSIPEEQRRQFTLELGDRTGLLQDEETLTTLETFFALDCNVSETAKRLYIHRNTLLYRIDKFKQETGLDVRTFDDAVLVKLELLLYKVTKRP
ncbi:helix-turn-helix domain-containing protein [Paenibacillus sp. MBLB2552]|uniref:Helix-turn-helix domain-containing protein n=1 Tax=Paenibacillus mellifer TaxID=2937794 RepID=A0A9X1Y354_9BACL|nr:helix-turn-helix domain-containing protein [Paenibacillus mellifer]MCK8489616.1 helix-turn-helix domain-containing protein [Paenibacillus mellifer]